ncbi:nucleotidyltransferase family protein [Fictibacillus sp. KIGAM418]|uniref:Nucleotidyltransferase family protein n=1 Tax=Fictibacillus marinisediminis TaxID=2878389 RepID=A0A9X1XCJ3_9BACL|nr:nucleotidyltransferase family protein [Fictibacillus marinisediminis]
MNSRMPSVSAILLAAGRSSRMGTLKALLPWRETSLVRYQTETLLNAGIDDIAVILGYKASELSKELSSYNVKTVINKAYESGKCSSIKAGMAGLSPSSTGVVIAAVDQPLSLNVIRQLYKFHGEQPVSIIIPAFNGKRGHPLLIPEQFYPELCSISEQTQGLRHFLSNRQNEIATVEINEPSILLNLNEQADYQSACWEDS